MYSLQEHQELDEKANFITEVLVDAYEGVCPLPRKWRRQNPPIPSGYIVNVW